MKRLIYLIIFLICSNGYNQNKRLAEKKFNEFNYPASAEIYEKLYQNGDRSFKVISRIADSYYLNSKTEQSEIWYRKLFNEVQEVSIPADFYFKYAQSLKSNGKYEESDHWLMKFRSKSKEDSRGKAIENNQDYLKEYTKARRKIIKLKNLELNTKYSDFALSMVNNHQVIFASSRPDPNRNKELYKWNHQPFLDLYMGEPDYQIDHDKGNIISLSVKNISNLSTLNTDFHEASAVVTKDGKTIYFTRVNYLKKLKKDDKGTVNLKLFKAVKSNGVWTNITELPFNSDDYSVGHPALSPDEKELYFVSDMPGSLGKTDLYKVTIENHQQYGTPTNLGAGVNTEGREMFPFISEENALYFSSDGHLGLGLLDIFISKNNFSSVENLGSPYNSPKDDFAFSINSQGTYGYLSSNRVGGRGDDDIYAFTVQLPEEKCEQEILGVIVDVDSGKLLPNTMVSLSDDEGQQFKQVIVGENAAFSFSAKCHKSYTLTGNNDLYDVAEINIKTNDKEARINALLKLKLKEVFVAKEEKVLIDIPPIYFDFDKSNIRVDAKKALDKLVDVMIKYPNLVVEIGSHTDRRANDRYNDNLSAKRASATLGYIVSKGITEDRISARGYGERKPVNKCIDGVWCNEDDHQLNRRTEFVVKNYRSFSQSDSLWLAKAKNIKSGPQFSKNKGIYIVEEENTLYSISKKFNISIPRLKLINGLEDNTIRVGQKLRIESDNLTNDMSFYIVQNEDTLYSISKLTGMAISSLKNINQLTSNTIKVGQRLKIK